MSFRPYLLPTCLLLAVAAWKGGGQAPADSAAARSPDLSGKWRLTTPLGGATDIMTVVQTGNRLEAEISWHVRCGGHDVRVQLNLAGFVQGKVVRLRSTGGRLEGDLESRCAQYGEVTGQVDFEGEISSDGKKIVGPYDHSSQATHTWTLTR